MSLFHVGQMVVCIDDRRVNGSLFGLTKSRIYTIRENTACPNGDPGVRLDEIIRPGTDVPYFSWRFRPVKETSIEIFRKLVAPMPFSAWQTGERVKNYE